MTSTLKDTGCKPQSHGQAVPGGGACPLCRRPRCSAAAKTRPGERCRKNPHPGASICTNHGLTEAGRAAAERKRAEDEAEREVKDLLWAGLADAAPVDNPYDLLARTAAVLEHMADVVGERVNALRTVGAGENLTQLRAEAVLLDKTLDKLIRASESMAKLDLGARQAEHYRRMANGQAEVVEGAAVEGYAAVAAFVQASLGSVLPAEAEDVYRVAFVGALRRMSVETVAGEVLP